MSVELLLNTPEIAVIGPPNTVEIQLDFGPTGQRGSKIFSGFDDPNTTSPSSNVLANDIYIRESQGQTEGYIYQYLSDGIGGYQWEKIGNLKPAIYTEISNIAPVGGLYPYSVSLATAFSNYSVSSITADNVSVQVTPELSTASVPLLVTIYSKSINSLSNEIEIDFNVLEYSGSSWATSTNTDINFHITLSLLS